MLNKIFKTLTSTQALSMLYAYVAFDILIPCVSLDVAISIVLITSSVIELVDEALYGTMKVSNIIFAGLGLLLRMYVTALYI